MNTLPVTIPRGATAEGFVRTTGWLFIQGKTVSSALLVAVLFFVLPIVLIPQGYVGVLPVFTALAGYGRWKLLTMRVRPASRADNLETVPAICLAEGQWVRLYGDIGPVAQITRMAFTAEVVDVQLFGGAQFRWPADRRIRLVRLIN